MQSKLYQPNSSKVSVQGVRASREHCKNLRVEKLSSYLEYTVLSQLALKGTVGYVERC
jgi:hypothetical protein